MTLSEKIYYCRKRQGKSQEALAFELGVSRQAVSKWETGEAEPEIGKLRLLAQTFGVTTDWLLSDAEPDEDPGEEPRGFSAPEPSETPDPPMSQSSWVEAVPGAVGRLLRRYGWLVGVYVAVIGGALAGIGALARFLAGRMVSGFSRAVDEVTIMGGTAYSSAGGVPVDLPAEVVEDVLGAASPGTELMQNNPVSVLGGVLMVAGLVVLAAGVVLALVLRRKRDR